MEAGQRLGAIEQLLAAVSSSGAGGGAGLQVNLNGPITAYDPSDVVHEIDKQRSRELAVSGVLEGG